MKEASITIRDVAKMAKVSVATVSRVINNAGNVKEETAERVKEAIEKTGFKPNAIARSLFTKSSRLIGCVLPDITNQFFSKIFLQLERECLKFGYSLLLFNSMNDFEMESFFLNVLLEHQVDGIFFLGGRINEIGLNAKYIIELQDVAKQVPLVLINGKVNIDNASFVYTDEFDAVEKIVKFLYEKGHRSIGMIGGYHNIDVSVNKMNTFNNLVVNKYTMDLTKTFSVYGGYNVNQGYELFQEIHRERQLPSAILCMNDEVAVGVIKACHEQKIKVPEQLSVMGYDNVEFSQMIYPGLTTFGYDYANIARLAVEMMSKLIDEDECEKEIVVKGEIIERGSVI